MPENEEKYGTHDCCIRPSGMTNEKRAQGITALRIFLFR